MTDATVPFRPAKKADGTTPHEVAERMIEAAPIKVDPVGLVWRYTGTHWVQATGAWLRAAAHRAGGFNRDLREKAIDQVKALTFDDGFAWNTTTETEVACLNGVVDVLTGRRRDHRPGDMLERVVPHAWDPGAACPLWLECLVDWFGERGDGGEARALQQFMGYCILPHARFKKAAVLVGESDTGKSKVAEVARLLVGAEHTCHLPVEKMDDPKLLAVIVGKALNVVTEVTEGALLKDGGFKTLVSAEEPVLVDPKYHPSFTYCPAAKHLIACNHLPRINDPSRGVFNRLLVIPFGRVIPKDRQDPQLLAKLTLEAPGILTWALEGARQLIEANGVFEQPRAGDRFMADFSLDNNPAARFVQERMVSNKDSGGTVVWATPLSEMLRAFNAWQGGRRLSIRQLGSYLRRAGYVVKPVRFGTGGRQVAVALSGYRFSDDPIGKELDENEHPDSDPDTAEGAT
jgi:P4 family phage/plasmid primase-like protien